MKSKKANVAKPAVQDGAVRVLKRATCPSVSGKSSLVYEVGVDQKSKDVLLHVVSNSGGGCFSSEWLKLDAIRALLDKAPKGATVTSHVLAPLVRGVSQNTAGFVWAVLVHAGLVAPSTEKKRAYDRTDPSAFLAEVRALVEGKPVPEAKAKPPKTAAAKPKKDKPAKKAA